MNLKRAIYLSLTLLIALVNVPHSQGKPVPSQSDLQVSLHVSYNKETKKFLIEGQVVNLGPAPSIAEGRVVLLITWIKITPKDPFYQPFGVFGPGNASNHREVPALKVLGAAGSKEDPDTIFKVSDEVEKFEKSDAKREYFFKIKLLPSKSDPNPHNDEAEFAASNIGRGK